MNFRKPSQRLRIIHNWPHSGFLNVCLNCQDITWQSYTWSGARPLAMASLLDSHLELLHRYAYRMIVRECNSYSSSVICLSFLLSSWELFLHSMLLLGFPMLAHAASFEICYFYLLLVLPACAAWPTSPGDMMWISVGCGLGILAGEIAAHFSGISCPSSSRCETRFVVKTPYWCEPTPFTGHRPLMCVLFLLTVICSPVSALS